MDESSTYQENDLDWLATIPADWQRKCLRHVADCLDGKRMPLNREERSHKQGTIPYWGANSIMDFVDEAIFDETLVLLGEDGAPFFDKGRNVAFLSTGPIWPNNHVHVLRTVSDYDAAFLVYCLNSVDFFYYVNGSTRDKLTQESMNAIRIPSPPAKKQREIVRVLDYETAKIDALIADQERLMALLKEKRQAVISQAVTKGLDPDAPMTKSDVEWLGKVPAHWEVVRLGKLFREALDEGEHDLPVLSVSIHHGVSDRELLDNEVDRKVTRSEDRTKYKKVIPGDLAYNMMRAWQGGFGTVCVTGMVSPAYVVARPRADFRTQFVELLLRTPQAVEEMRRSSKGVTDFRLRLYWEEFKQIRIALPPLSEQELILTAISAENSYIDKLSAEAERVVTILKERRAALISAGVTGKIDVRNLIPAEAEAA